MCFSLPYPTEYEGLKFPVWLFYKGAWGALFAPLVRPLSPVLVGVGLFGGKYEEMFASYYISSPTS